MASNNPNTCDYKSDTTLTSLIVKVPIHSPELEQVEIGLAVTVKPNRSLVKGCEGKQIIKEKIKCFTSNNIIVCNQLFLLYEERYSSDAESERENVPVGRGKL